MEILWNHSKGTHNYFLLTEQLVFSDSSEGNPLPKHIERKPREECKRYELYTQKFSNIAIFTEATKPMLVIT